MVQYHTGPWTLADLRDGKIGMPSNGLRVFSCFSCGGGSSMGYKLAGYDVVGFCEIDPRMADCYVRNLGSDYPNVIGISEFNKSLEANGVPDWLLGIDVLDGSPPCSSFSMAGNREKDWGKDKKFREGQSKQVLDDLFFHFIKTMTLVKPRVVIAENVKGLILGDAKKYVAEIFLRMDDAGYDVQLFLLDSDSMGVPQRRERTFFIAKRKDIAAPKLSLVFNDKSIPLSSAFEGLVPDSTGEPLTPLATKYWRNTFPGRSFSDAAKGKWFSWIRLHKDKSSPTLPATSRHCHFADPRFITFAEAKRIQSFPDDYDFGSEDGRYVCGMSVPPLMMQRVSGEVARQLFNPILEPIVPDSQVSYAEP